jgi:hypothetical protein
MLNKTIETLDLGAVTGGVYPDPAAFATDISRFSTSIAQPGYPHVDPADYQRAAAAWQRFGMESEGQSVGPDTTGISHGGW